MKSLIEQVGQYRHQHTKLINKMTHFVGIPAIIIGVLIPLNWLSVSISADWHLRLSWVVVFATWVYYFFLNTRLAAAMTIILCMINIISAWIAFPAPNKINLLYFVVLFFGGWTLQFVGHYFERSRPAFLNSLGQLLIGPLFLLIELIHLFKLEKYFNLQA